MDDIILSRLKQFDLEGDNLDHVAQLGKILVPSLEGVLDRFYENALGNKTTAAFFDSPQMVAHARQAQNEHWQRLLSGTFEKSYLDSANAIGRVHFRVQLPVSLYLAAYARATSDLQLVLLKHTSGGLFRRRTAYAGKMLGVLTRVLALDTELVIAAYIAAHGEEQKTAFLHVERAVDQIKQGNLTYHIPPPDESDFPASYDPLRVALNGAVGQLAHMLGSVRDLIQSLGSMVEQVGQGTHQLSSRTEGQAASLEQTAFAMHEITESVASSTKSTSAADQVAQDARREVQNGAQVVNQAADAMNRIQTSSDKITQIIGLIDDIAFQTNLLALNAGVEAARAGEAGRGFAVVAGEVRSLASSASEAAKEIKDLILTSSQEVSHGVQLVGQAGETLAKIVKDFERVSTLASSIAAASTEQSTGLQQMNSAIAEMDTVTQRNAAMVQETKAATAVMTDAAQRLNAQITRFRIDTAPATAERSGRATAKVA